MEENSYCNEETLSCKDKEKSGCEMAHYPYYNLNGLEELIGAAPKPSEISV